MNTEPTSTRTFLQDSHAATPGGSRFDLQRAALDQLMGLASECSRNYHQLELTHSEALAAAEAEFGRAKSGLRAQLDVRRAAIEEESQEAVGRHEQTFEEARTRIAGQMTGQRSELDQRQRRTDKQLGKEHSDGLWLVDTMLEGESARIEEANASMRKALAEDARQLDDLRAAADALAEKYGQTLPPAGASEEQEVSAAVDEPADLERVLESRRAGVEAELARMRRLLLPKVALGRMPWILAFPLLLGAAVVGHALSVDRPRTAALVSRM